MAVLCAPIWKHFSDVTLVYSDDQQNKAHKIILAWPDRSKIGWPAPCTGQLGQCTAVGKAAIRLLDIWRMSRQQNPGENGARLGVCCDDPGQRLKHFISPWQAVPLMREVVTSGSELMF